MEVEQSPFSCPVCQLPANSFFCAECIARGETKCDKPKHSRKRSVSVKTESSSTNSEDRLKSLQLTEKDIEKGLQQVQLSGTVYSAVTQIRLKLEHTKAMVSTFSERMDKDRVRAAAKIEELRLRRARLLEANDRFRALQNQIDEPEVKYFHDAILHSLSNVHESCQDKLAQERRLRIANLLQLFPIDLHASYERSGTSNAPWQSSGTIAGVPFPSPSTLYGSNTLDKSVSTALALQVQVVLLASKYLSMPLPYPLEFRGSIARVGIWGLDGTEPPQNTAVMQGNGKHMISLEPEDPRFTDGLQRLESNIRALCYYQGVPATMVHRQDTLHNLWQLLHSPSLGQSIHKAITSARHRTGLRSHPSSAGMNPRVATGDTAAPATCTTLPEPKEVQRSFNAQKEREQNNRKQQTNPKSSLQDDWESVPVPVPPPPSEPSLVELWEASTHSR